MKYLFTFTVVFVVDVTGLIFPLSSLNVEIFVESLVFNVELFLDDILKTKLVTLAQFY